MAPVRRIDRARGGGRRPDAGCAGADAGSVAGDTVLRGGWLFDAAGDQAVRNGNLGDIEIELSCVNLGKVQDVVDHPSGSA